MLEKFREYIGKLLRRFREKSRRNSSRSPRSISQMHFGKNLMEASDSSVIPTELSSGIPPVNFSGIPLLIPLGLVRFFHRFLHRFLLGFFTKCIWEIHLRLLLEFFLEFFSQNLCRILPLNLHWISQAIAPRDLL